MGYGVSDMLQSTTSLTSSSPVVQVGTVPNVLDQWKIITSNRIVLNIVCGHNLWFKSHPGIP